MQLTSRLSDASVIHSDMMVGVTTDKVLVKGESAIKNVHGSTWYKHKVIWLIHDIDLVLWEAGPTLVRRVIYSGISKILCITVLSILVEILVDSVDKWCSVINCFMEKFSGT